MTAPTQRLFFALAPDVSVRQAIAAALPAEPAPGRPVPPANYHVTLAFLGTLEPPRREAALAAAAEVTAEAFELRFQQLVLWERARARVLEPEAVPAAAMALRERLVGALTRHGVPFDDRPWRPHLTVARRARSPFAVEPLDVVMACRAFALFESRSGPEGVTYQSLAHWPLGPAGGGRGGTSME